jgi:6-phosphogluconolactonase
MSLGPTAETAVSKDDHDLARTVAERLVEVLIGIQAEGRVPSVVLTGGSIADQVHRAVLDVPEHADVDWSRVDVWFGDERFVAADDSDRNALQAREAFLSALPVDPARVHEMPAWDGEHGDDVDAAAAAYAEEIRQVLGEEPRFDVLMLGIGPDGHCASLFPGHEAVRADGTVVGVHDSPKPPPKRISLTMGMLRRSEEVWFLASGEEKAPAVHDAITGEDVGSVPASGPRGRARTLWLLDRAAASRLPGH